MGRESILARVRQALARPSPEPHWLHADRGSENLFPVADTSPDALAATFAAELATLFGEFHPAASMEEGQRRLTELAAEAGWKEVLVPDSPRLRAVAGGLPGVRWVPADAPDRDGWHHADAAVTPVLALVAESATAVVSAPVSGRALTVLPPAHVVVATADQLVPDLPAALALVRQRYPQRLPSSLSLITGPSRTADIEKILVLGAHGPRRLAVLLLPAGSLPDAT